MEIKESFENLWKDVIQKKKIEELPRVCQVIINEKTQDFPHDFLKNLGNALVEFYSYCLKERVLLKIMHENLSTIFKVFHNSFKQNISGVPNNFLDKTKEFLRTIISQKPVNQSESEALSSLIIVILEILGIITEYKSITGIEERLLTFLVSVYQSLLSKCFSDQDIRQLCVNPFLPEDRFIIKLPGYPKTAQDIIILTLANLKKVLELIHHLNDPNLSLFLSNLLESLLNCTDFQSLEESTKSLLTFQKLQLFYSIQKLMLTKSQKKDQKKLFLKLSSEKCKDLVYLSLIFSNRISELDEITNFKKDLSPLGITFSLICNLFSDTYYEEIESILLTAFEKIVHTRGSEISSKFLNYSLQLLKIYFKNLGLRCSRSLWLNSEDSGLLQLLFTKSVFIPSVNGGYFIDIKKTENWNKIWIVICKNSRNFKWLSSGILKNLHQFFEDFSYVVSIKDWVISQLVTNEKYLKESIKSSFVEDLLLLVKDRIFQIEFSDNTQALLQVIVFILGMKEYFVNYNPTPITKILCSLISSSSPIFTDSLFRCLGEVIKIIHHESHQTIREFLDSLHNPSAIFKLVQIVSSIVRSSKTSGEVVWPLCRSGWLITFKNKLLVDLPKLAPELQIQLWREILLIIKILLLNNELCQSKVCDFEFNSVAKILTIKELDESLDFICEETVELVFEILFDREVGKGSNKIRTPEILPLVLTMILYSKDSEKMVKAREKFQILMLSQNSLPYLGKFGCLGIVLDYFSQENASHYDLFEKILTQVVPYNLLPQDLTKIFSLLQTVNDKKRLFLLQCLEQSIANCISDTKFISYLVPSKFLFFRSKKYLSLSIPEDQMAKKQEFSVFFWICFSKLKKKTVLADLQDKSLNRFKLKADSNSLWVIYTDGKKKKFKAKGEVNLLTKEWYFIGVSFFNQSVVKYFRPKENFNLVLNSQVVNCKISGALPSSVGNFKTLTLGKSMRKTRVVDARITSFFISSVCLYYENFESIRNSFPVLLSQFNQDCWSCFLDFPVVSKVISENPLFKIVPFMAEVSEKSGNFQEKDCERFLGVNLFEAFSDLGGLKTLLSLIDFAQFNENFALTVVKIVLHIIKCPESRVLVDQDFVRSLAYMMSQMPSTQNSIENIFQVAASLENSHWQQEFLRLTQLNDLGQAVNPGDKYKCLTIFLKLIKQNFVCDKFCLLIVFSFVKDLELTPEEFMTTLFSIIPLEVNEEIMKAVNLLVFVSTYYLKNRVLAGVVFGLMNLMVKVEKGSPLEMTLMNALQVLPGLQGRISLIQYLLLKKFRNWEKMGNSDCEEICTGIAHALEDNYDSDIIIQLIETLANYKGSLLKSSRQFMVNLILHKLSLKIDNLPEILNKLLDFSNKLSQKIYKSENFLETFKFLFKNKSEFQSLLKNLLVSVMVFQKKMKNFHKLRKLLRSLSKVGINTLELYHSIFISLKSGFQPVLFLDFAQILEECLPGNLETFKGIYKTIIKDLVNFSKTSKLLQYSEPSLQQLSMTELRSKLKTREKRQSLRDEAYMKEGGFFRLVLKYVLIGISLENTSEYFEMLPEILLSTEQTTVLGKLNKYSEITTRPVMRDFYDLYIFTEILHIFYHSEDPESLFVDFLLIFIVDFSIYEKLFALVSSQKKEDVISYKQIILENFEEIFPSFRNHLPPEKRNNLSRLFPDLDVTSSFLINADENTSFKIFLGKMLEKMVCFKQTKENSEALLHLLKSKEWVADIHFFLTVSTSVRVNLACDSFKSFKMVKEEKVELDRAYRYDSDVWMVLQQTLIDWVKAAFEEQNRLKNFIRYKYQKFVKGRRENDENGLNETRDLFKVRNCMDHEKRNIFLRKFTKKGNEKERFASPTRPDRVVENYFESLYDVSQIEYDLNDITEYSDLNIAGGLARECEMIKIKGSFYGKLEIDSNFLAFYSDGSFKPKNESYVGSAPEFTKESKVFNYIWHVSEISEVFPRRYIHRPTGMEVFLKSGKSYFFNFFSSHQCKDLFQQVEVWKSSGVQVFSSISEKDVFQLTQSWKKNQLSTFEYLKQVNKYANRSYNDLSQYPVFPWVLSKYSEETLNLKDESSYRDLSLPIGALSETSRESARRRFEMISPDDEMIPFHHGTHYSTGGSVSYYMVRLEPFTSQAKKIQNDSFDMPDRLFHSVQTSWESCLSNNSDVKELIPEFFYLPEMFLNVNNYELGFTQAGKNVGKVSLPKWSNSALDFVKSHRQALESNFVSRNIHLWIDLVFGVKQIGKLSVEAFNVFGPAAYLNSFEKIARHADNVQGVIDEAYFFGMVPSMLFKKPHPPRDPAEKDRCDSWGGLWTEQGKGFDFNMIQTEKPAKFLAVFILNKTILVIKHEKNRLILVKIRNFKTIEETPLDSVELASYDSWPGSIYWRPSVPSLRDLVDPSSQHFSIFQEKYLVSGLHQDSSLKLHSLDGSLFKSLHIHSGLVVSVATSSKLIFSGGLGNALNGWSQSEFKTFTGHKAPVRLILAQETLQMLFSLNVEGKLLIHDMRSTECIRRVTQLGFISCFAVSPLGFLTFALKDDKKVFVSSLNGFEISPIQGINEIVTCMKFDFFGDVIICGTGESVVVKNVFENKMIRKKVEGSVWALEIMKDPDCLVFLINFSVFGKVFMSSCE